VDPKQRRSISHTLSMIPSRCSEHPSFSQDRAELRQFVVSTTELEGSHLLEVLQLEIDLFPRHLGEGIRIDYWSLGIAFRILFALLLSLPRVSRNMTPSYEDFSSRDCPVVFPRWVLIQPYAATMASPQYLDNGSMISLTPRKEGTKHVSCPPWILLKPAQGVSIPVFPERHVNTKSMPIGNNTLTEGNLHAEKHLKLVVRFLEFRVLDIVIRPSY
jgi:hypothetical protein